MAGIELENGEGQPNFIHQLESATSTRKEEEWDFLTG